MTCYCGHDHDPEEPHGACTTRRSCAARVGETPAMVISRLASELADARRQLAICADDTTAADLAQDLACAKAEIAELRERLEALGRKVR